jgi:hypothetical protein
MKGTLVIEFEYDNEAMGIRQIEKDGLRWAERYASEHDGMTTVTHVEASCGNMKTAFGIGQ